MSSELKLPLGAADIQRLIPHRYPFLLIDRITEFDPAAGRIVGLKAVTINEQFFQGHFPGMPLMPGVLILEAMAQLGAVYSRLVPGGLAPDKLVVFSGLDEARFRRPVVPGDVLKIELHLIKRKLGTWRMGGKATVDGEFAAEAIVQASEVTRQI